MSPSQRTPPSPSSWRNRRRIGFTLVELLVVFAIVVLLIALFIPAISTARHASRKLQCLNNLKQHAISLQNYHDTEGTFPPGWSSNASGMPGWGWGTRVLLYAEQRMLADTITYEQGLDSLGNKGAIATSLATFKCPADTNAWDAPVELKLPGGRKLQLASASFVGNFGSTSFAKCDPLNPDGACEGNGVFFRNSYLRMADFEDGASQTMMVSERRVDRLTAVWAGVVPGVKDAVGRVLGHAGVPPNDGSTEYGFSSHHPHGVNVVFGDGGVRFVTDDVDPEVFKALATTKGKELNVDLYRRN